MGKRHDQLTEGFSSNRTETPNIPIDTEFCSSCGDQEGGCRQCGFGREYKKFLAEQAAEERRKTALANERERQIEEDAKKIFDSFKN